MTIYLIQLEEQDEPSIPIKAFTDEVKANAALIRYSSQIKQSSFKAFILQEVELE
jgi:hypothetical protein